MIIIVRLIVVHVRIRALVCAGRSFAIHFGLAEKISTERMFVQRRSKVRESGEVVVAGQAPASLVWRKINPGRSRGFSGSDLTTLEQEPLPSMRALLDYRIILVFIAQAALISFYRSSTILNLDTMASKMEDDGCFVALTHDTLDAKAMMDKVRSPTAGAIVLFAGTSLPTVKSDLAKPSRNNSRQLRRQAGQRPPIHILRTPCSTNHALNLQRHENQVLASIDRHDAPPRYRSYRRREHSHHVIFATSASSVESRRGSVGIV